MDDDERARLLRRVGRHNATLGVSVPETITVDGEDVALRSYVFEVRGADALPAEAARRLDALRKALRWERNEREQRLREADLTVEEGEALAESILGIDRALELLADPGEADLAAEMADSERQDVERWLDFLQSVT